MTRAERKTDFMLRAAFRLEQFVAHMNSPLGSESAAEIRPFLELEAALKTARLAVLPTQSTETEFIEQVSFRFRLFDIDKSLLAQLATAKAPDQMLEFNRPEFNPLEFN